MKTNLIVKMGDTTRYADVRSECVNGTYQISSKPISGRHTHQVVKGTSTTDKVQHEADMLAVKANIEAGRKPDLA